MPFGISVPQLARFPQRLPAITTLTDLQLPRGRGLWGRPAPIVTSLPVLRAHRPAISLVAFATHHG